MHHLHVGHRAQCAGEVTVETQANRKRVIPKKKYVGSEKADSDSFTPRKLINVITKMMPNEIQTRYGSRSGNADVICATPDEMDTATVKCNR